MSSLPNKRNTTEKESKHATLLEVQTAKRGKTSYSFRNIFAFSSLLLQSVSNTVNFVFFPHSFIVNK